MNKCLEYTIKPGAYLVVWLIGETRKYIAEVKQVEPLRLKIQESGPLANLKEGDIIVLDEDTAQIQSDQRRQQKLFMRNKFYGHPLLSGLKSLGVADDKLHEILAENEVKSTT